MPATQLEHTIALMTRNQCGILAADESVPTITKRLEAVGLVSDEPTRLAYRTMLLNTPSLSDHVAAVILHEETLYQSIDQIAIPRFCVEKNIMPGIKVDMGLVNWNAHEKVTEGLDGLDARLTRYQAQGAVFCKWRAVYDVTHLSETVNCIQAQRLAQYAKTCQNHNLVPIVEPEVLIDGTHTIQQCFQASERVLHALFQALFAHQVQLETIVLKPSMVIAGKQASTQASIEEVSRATLTVLQRHVPAAVPTINFLSGGQTPQQATDHLATMNAIETAKPWRLSFSYARALQEPCLAAWAEHGQDNTKAQQQLLERAQANSQTMCTMATT